MNEPVPIQDDSGSPSLAAFLRALFSGADPVVLPYAADGVAVTEAVTGDAAHLLREREERVREDLAGEAPPYDAGAAGWAARAFLPGLPVSGR